ncbi:MULTISPECIES: beta-ketoacyl-[acyl-carrier-protein] synthase family protein [Hyphomicrobium]|uniref:3-oxoacyl-[acyl-carrier-protein] synthase, KASII n=1 Tax=Hyphomicrobium sulfonivorans TaxID=121290 RepID=A0A125NWB8_HYPSL|nr:MULTISPECIES: beta-ketoacyl-[acyl-carrier-protein] synthase family protein [Hyphomicrobium]KWT72418.1 3-oxoacyl-[acyl-carrier-protein] synthase, KASII [Hyphomicrobium sulfonivorans]MBI1650380.1 beta-ketoacyl-[acyl-carrier-protein] synthase family protein [Hyphomicrobium sulfonivorans]MDH4981799.1 beta-ketoacyl-[acyl-carrier-protein] synthase family protein [Hyphomicrobium sp. D-2]NSL72257.1 beta-ketoacyl-[acyl-carrier-protein] synthase family protein [Hyphomicrobium sulfonivorans]
MANANGARRVVVTGMGVVTPIGLNVPDFWASMQEGKCGVTALEGFPLEDLKIRIAAQIKDFDPKQRLRHFQRDKLVMHADRYSWFAAASADEAVKQSGLEFPIANPYRSACIIGSGAGGLVTFENSYRSLFIENKRATHPLTLLRIIGSSASAHVGIEFGIKGPTFATCSACSTATHAIALGVDYIRNNVVDVAIVGASESVINYGTMKAWQALHVLSPEGCFPFAKKRNGTVLGEGAGTLVIESLEHAQARGANILAEIVGYGMSSDAKDMVNPDIEGPNEAMRRALDDAKLAPSDIQYLNAHGTATTINDANETNAIKAVFGNHAKNLAISSTKSMTGHPLGAGGGIEAATCVKVVNENWVPPTIGLDDPDPDCDLDYIPNVGRNLDVTYAMSNSFAFGGLNAVLIFGPAPN